MPIRYIKASFAAILYIDTADSRFENNFLERSFCRPINVNDNFFNGFCNHLGETVTIYTKSGGQSGFGFTGVVLGVTDDFVRLITHIGPAPGCALGSDCTDGRGCRRCRGRHDIRTVGSNVDIPFDAIAAVVYNAV